MPEVSVILHRVTPSDPMTWRQDDHVLIVPLPAQTMTLDLRDLRLFFLRAVAGTTGANG